jgi:ribonuclease VapC
VILDSSAILAVLFSEPDLPRLRHKLQASLGTVKVGAPTLLETSIVLANRRGVAFLEELDGFLRGLSVTVLPFGEAHWAEATTAHRRFGKGRHPAALNFGDCLAYAVAKVAREPLLFVGNDFLQTDLDIA